MALLIPLRTAGASPFYLLVPLFYLSILLCATAAVFWDAARRAATKAAVQAVVGVALILHVWGLAWPYPSYAHVAEMSDNFTSALAAVRQHIGRLSNPPTLVFWWPRSEPLAYMFLGSRESRGLAAYILPSGASKAQLSSIDSVMRDKAYVVLPQRIAAPGELAVVLGPSLKLERIESSH
jgi:hypothetical protein